MGNNPNQWESSSSETNRIYDNLPLELDNHGFTNNCLYRSFLMELLFTNKKGIDRRWNPLCPFQMKITQNWMTCCLISPIMALASPLYIFNKNDEFCSECLVLVSNGKNIEAIKVIDAVLIKQHQLCLLIFEKSFFKVGWMSISYIKDIEQIKENRLKIVNHPQKIYKGGSNTIHIQKIKEIQLNQKAYTQNKNFIFKNKDIDGSIIIKIQSRIPSIVGIQINQNQVMLFDKKIFYTICSKAQNYIDLHKKYFVDEKREIVSSEMEISSAI